MMTTYLVDAQKALADSKQLLAMAGDLARISMAIVDTDGHWLAANTPCCQQLGYEEAELLNTSYCDLVHPEDRRAEKLTWREVLAACCAQPLEHRFKHRSGRHVWLSSSFSPIRSQDNTLLFYLLRIENITDRKLGEQHRVLMNFALNQVSEAAYLLDENDRLTYVNDAACHALGYSREELLQMEMGDIHRDGWPEITRTTLNNSAAPHLVAEAMHTRQDGSQFPVEIHASLFEYEGVPYRLVMVRDIGDRKAAEQQLRSQEQLYHTLVDHLPDPVIRYDSEGKRVFLNPVAEALLQRPTAELLGKTSLELNPASQALQEYVDRVKHVVATGEASDFDFFMDRQPSDLQVHNKVIAVRMVPERDPEGRIAGVLAVGRDVSMLKEAQRKFSSLLENIPDLIARFDLQGRYLYVNPTFCETFGMKAADLIGQQDITWPGEAGQSAPILKSIQEVAQREEAITVTLDVALNGKPSYLEWRLIPESDQQGRVISVLAVGRDMTQLRMHERLEQMRLLILESLAHGDAFSSVLDLVTRYMEQAKPGFLCSIMLLDNTGTHLLCTHAPSLPADFITAVDGIAIGMGVGSCGTAAVLQERVLVDDIRTHPYWAPYKEIALAANLLACWSEPIFDSAHRMLGTFAIYRREAGSPSAEDLNFIHQASHLVAIAIERHRSDTQLQERERELRSLLDNSPDTITRYDANCRRLYVNQRMLEYFDTTPDVVLHTTPRDFPGGSVTVEYEARIRQAFLTGQPDELELPLKASNGKLLVRHIRMMPEFNPDGTVASVLAVGRDITEIVEYRQRIHDMAFYDALTRLPNRAMLLEQMRSGILAAAGAQQVFSLMVLDLDRFKQINETLGHSTGDLLLCEAAARLQDHLREGDMLARMGGDEFVLLLRPGDAEPELIAMAQTLIQAFRQPFLVAGRELFVSTSVGIARYPTDSQDADTLLKFADTAMYHAKAQGRNNFQFYVSALTEVSSARIELETMMRRAIQQQELELYYQPQWDLLENRIVGVEALLRWNQTEHGLMMPNVFIPVAEETGLIIELGEWVLTTACRQAVQWNKDKDEPLKIAVNLSTRQFIQNPLLASVTRILHETGCRPEWIKLEITESLLLESNLDILNTLNAFDAMGLVISIDDFGTGYSALSYLNRFPVKQIKIDRSFVKDVPHDTHKSELVKAMISIAHVLNLDVVAEGVETQVQSDYLKASGCRAVQGYFYGRPMPLAALEAMLREQALTRKPADI
ncbi:sensor domain-containing protein [Methylovorus glucosotrophus]|uniref:Diguanylate cyclase/phosphodiesterase with PAS/PAC and GAF sensor(S) n=1 Tax=Methylovorus glucosotrophus (strain SIP3-4) TaxID=582744 RepID=C6X7M1_METGS|nr:EAL domain-containing protein [Methylovorus glucosotrophus]ACT49263.1 diguanylate cyclase/phosphodiesterase with PAS/PAC and GAF sensor(s) [Methylovorus glucosotrophus SIP3-4]